MEKFDRLLRSRWKPMLLIAIPLAWLAVVIVLVAACRAAADGDLRAASSKWADAPIGARVVLSGARPVGAHTGRARRMSRRAHAAHRGARRRIATR
jgi:hypothetical protein